MQAPRKKSGKKKKKGSGMGLTIAALIGGAALLIILVVVFGRAAGLFGNSSTNSGKTETEQKTEESASNMATVPDLVGKTEDEAKTLANDAHLGVQMAGEESSNQEKGKISRQESQRELRWKNIQL